MTLSKQDIRAIYQRQAKKYDFAVKLYPLIGLRIQAYRLRAVQLLRLKRGDCVVDLGCGTGLNFPLLVEQIGLDGRVIGVDFSPEMLARARQRCEHAGWKQVELVQADIAAYDFPRNVNGVLSTGVFGYVAEYECVIEAAAQALAPGGRLVIPVGDGLDQELIVLERTKFGFERRRQFAVLFVDLVPGTKITG